MKATNMLLLSIPLLLTSCASQTTPLSNQTQSAHYNVQLGLGYLKEGNVPRAKSKLLLAMQQAPKQGFVLEAMAYYFESTQQNQKADDYYQRAISEAENQARAENNYGAFLCRLGKYQLAEGYLRQAARNPGYLDAAAAYENAGLCAMAAHKDQSAKIYFQKALARDPQLTTSRVELVKLKNGSRGQATG